MFDVEVENLTKRFGEFCAVDGLSLPWTTAKSSAFWVPTAQANRR